MNRAEKELHGYIESTERMSGADSYDSQEGDMSFFDDDNMDYFDGGVDAMSYAGGQPNVSISDPYVIQYANSTTNDVTAIIFGYNDYFGTANFGNPAAITITNLQGGTYGRLMAQSNNKFFKITKWRFQSSTSSQLQQTLTINHVDGNGKTQTAPFNLSILKDSYQQLSDQVDAVRPLTVDGNTFLTFTLKASATVVISMFPTSVLSGKAQLNGGHYQNNVRAPRLSGKNVAPVIINTASEVKAITK